jgi:hypothetical protein
MPCSGLAGIPECLYLAGVSQSVSTSCRLESLSGGGPSGLSQAIKARPVWASSGLPPPPPRPTESRSYSPSPRPKQTIILKEKQGER